MIKHRIIERPAFDVVGKKIWISGQDNNLFSQFWVQCREQGLFEIFTEISNLQPGVQTSGSTLGVSRVEKDPTNREFYYMIAIENPQDTKVTDLEVYQVPASQWAVFECWGKVPESIVKSEIYAFTKWLPSSEYEHAKAPEMEVYFAGTDGNSDQSYCEFWLPIIPRVKGK